ncbi:MAG: ribonuclease III [Zavarzinella sp.]
MLPVSESVNTTDIEGCEAILGYRFRDAKLLSTALTHRSSACTRLDSYERLELLGDAVLGLVCVEFLFRFQEEADEGTLTKLKSFLVSRASCKEMLLELGLATYLKISKGLGNAEELPESILAGTFEAILGAIYLDGGLEEVTRFLLPVLKHRMEAIDPVLQIENAKSQLQQYTQRKNGKTPKYLIIKEIGPDHLKQFLIAVQYESRTFSPAWGNSKKSAEIRAAANALAEIEDQPVPFSSGMTDV